MFRCGRRDRLRPERPDPSQLVARKSVGGFVLRLLFFVPAALGLGCGAHALGFTGKAGFFQTGLLEDENGLRHLADFVAAINGWNFGGHVTIRKPAHCRRHADDRRDDRARQRPDEGNGQKTGDGTATQKRIFQVQRRCLLFSCIGRRQAVQLFLDLGGGGAETVELALGLIAADFDDVGNRRFRGLAGSDLWFRQFLEEHGGGFLHVIDGLQDIRLACGKGAGFIELFQHDVALGENIVVCAVAAKQQEAALVDGLFQHRGRRTIHCLDDVLGPVVFDRDTLAPQRLPEYDRRGEQAHAHQGTEGDNELYVNGEIFQRHRKLSRRPDASEQASALQRSQFCEWEEMPSWQVPVAARALGTKCNTSLYIGLIEHSDFAVQHNLDRRQRHSRPFQR